MAGLKTRVVGVVGGKKSGKTTTIEILTRELTSRGFRIAVGKHIPDAGFTIDTSGKDTWRYVQSGAKTVVAVSLNEIATIEKACADLSLNEILKRCRGVDLIFLEGFRELLAEDRSVYKIVVAESAQDVEEAIQIFEPILAFTGSYAPSNAHPRIPYLNVLIEGKEIADLLEKVVIKPVLT